MVNSTRQGNKGSTQGDEDNLEKLINKVCTNFIAQLEEKLDTRLEKLDSKLSHVCNTLNNLNKTVSENSQGVSDLQIKVDALEQDQKRKCLRFGGIAESVNENLNAVISSFIIAQLKIQCSESDIDYVFRVGRGKQEDNGKPRTIIACFTLNNKRNEVLKARKLLKGTMFAVYEDLTIKRYELLGLAKKKYGNSNAWSSGGNVYYWDSKNEKKVLVRVKSDL